MAAVPLVHRGHDQRGLPRHLRHPRRRHAVAAVAVADRKNVDARRQGRQRFRHIVLHKPLPFSGGAGRRAPQPSAGSASPATGVPSVSRAYLPARRTNSPQAPANKKAAVNPKRPATQPADTGPTRSPRSPATRYTPMAAPATPGEARSATIAAGAGARYPITAPRAAAAASSEKNVLAQMKLTTTSRDT